MTIATRLDLINITREGALARVRDAQEKYNATLQEHGSASGEAVAAARELESAQANLEKTQLRAKLSYTLIVGDMVALSLQAPKAAKGLYEMAAGAKAAAASMTALQLATRATIVTAAALTIFSVGSNIIEDFRKKAALAKAGTEELSAEIERLETLQAKNLASRDVTLQKIGKEMQPRINELKGLLELADRKLSTPQNFVGPPAPNIDERNVAAYQAIAAATASIGLNLQQLNSSALSGLMSASGVTKDFAEQLMATRQAEEELVRSVLATNPALISQLEATRRKGETTAELAKRLGLTVEQEKELAAQGRITTEGIISQDEVMRRHKAGLEDSTRAQERLSDSFRRFLTDLTKQDEGTERIAQSTNSVVLRQRALLQSTLAQQLVTSTAAITADQFRKALIEVGYSESAAEAEVRKFTAALSDQERAMLGNLGKFSSYIAEIESGSRRAAAAASTISTASGGVRTSSVGGGGGAPAPAPTTVASTPAPSPSFIGPPAPAAFIGPPAPPPRAVAAPQTGPTPPSTPAALPPPIANIASSLLSFFGGRRAATGFQGRVSAPTLILTGEGGGAEDVSVTPAGQHRAQGGFARDITINITLPPGEGNARGVERAVVHALESVAQRRARAVRGF